jgi:hypothetical protein
LLRMTLQIWRYEVGRKSGSFALPRMTAKTNSCEGSLPVQGLVA